MIELKNVTKTYANKKNALKRINLNFPSRGMIFICGESGSGKTTLLNILGLLDKHTQGEYYFSNKHMNTLKNKQKDEFRNNNIGIIFQDINLLEELNIEDNILIPLQLQRMNRTSIIVEEIFKEINLNEDPKEYPINLSGGERQRVAILRALIKDSKLIIADEPTGSLDPKNASLVMELLSSIAKDRLVIIVTHQLDLAEKFGDRIITLDKGMVIDDKIINSIEESMSSSNSFSKANLSYKNAFKFASQWFFSGLGKLFFSLFSFFIALSAVLITISVLQYDESIAVKNGIKTERLSYFELSKLFDQSLNNYFTNNETEQLFSNMGDSNIIPVRVMHHLSYLNNINASTGYASVSNFNVHHYGLELNGILPTDFFDILITRYQAYILGFINEEEFVNRNSDQSIIGQTIEIDFWRGGFILDGDGNEINTKYHFNVVGVLDTNYTFPNQELLDNSLYSEIADYRLRYEMHSTIFFSQQTMDSLDNFYSSNDPNYTNDSMYFYINVTENNYNKIHEFIGNSSGSHRLKLNHRLLPSLNYLSNFKNTLWQISTVIAGVFLVISLFTFISFIHNLVESKIISIQILRSLGMSALSMNKIFIFQNLLISILITIVSGSTAFMVGSSMNGLIRDSFFVNIPLINFDLFSILYIFTFSLAISTLITYIKVKLSYSKVRIIEKRKVN